MSNNREFSQLASFINVDENNNFIGIATDGTQLVGIGTSSITLDGRTGIISARDLYLDGVNITDIIGTPEYVQQSGVSTSVIGGIASVTQLSVSGISTFSNDVEVGTGITFYAATGIISATAFYGSGQNLSDIIGTKLDGITVKEEGSSLPSAYGILDFVGDYVTATGVGTTATITFVAPNYASNSGVATNIKGGDAGDIPYQTAADTTSFIDASTAAVGQVILWNGSVPYWGNVSAASGSFGGITVEDEGTPVGTSGSITSLNFVGNNISVEATAGANGIATITVADYVSTAGVATALQNTRTFEITGDVVASPISFDGTGNVSLAATIQPNSVGLGTDTFGDYVKNISGTTNQIVVTGGTGEGSTPVISIPDSPVLPGTTVTVSNDLQVNNNLNVNGNITIGGTTAIIYAQEFIVSDKEIVLGFTTDSFGNEVSNDTTADGGGVSIASTEGNPLVDFTIAGVHTHPNTYKDIIWIKAGTLGAGTTDAWHFNYGVGIGSTQVPNGVRFAVSNIQFTDDDLTVVRNINASGIITGTLANDLTLNTSGNGISGIATYNNSGAVTFTVTSDATDANTAETIVYRDSSGNFSAGTITANLTGTATIASYASTAGIATYATSAGLSTSVIGGIASVTTLNVSGVSTLTQLSVNSSTGTNGQYLKATGSGLTWESFPTIRSTTNFNATASQTTFSVNYEVGYIDVYINGIRISDSEFTATNGTSVILDTPCFGGEEVTVIAYNTTSTGGSFANANYSGIVTATGGFSSGTGSPVEISVVGSTVTLNVAGIGSTTFTLS